MIEFRHSAMFSFIHFSTAGSAYKLSTGMSKNPCKQRKKHIHQVLDYIVSAMFKLQYVNKNVSKINIICNKFIQSKQNSLHNSQLSTLTSKTQCCSLFLMHCVLSVILTVSTRSKNITSDYCDATFGYCFHVSSVMSIL